MEDKSIDTVLSFLNQGWVGIIMGLFFGFIFYKLSNKKPIPSYQEHSLSIIKKNEIEQSDNIKILYDNKEVENLTKTQIVFWNNGSDTLKIENLVKDDPLLFEFSENSTMLSSKIIRYSRDINKATITTSSENKNIAHFNFDFFDENDGVLLEFIHTDTKLYPKFNGTFKGIPKGIQNFGQIYVAQKKCKGKLKCLLNNERFQFIFMSVFGALLLIIGLYPKLLEKITTLNNSINNFIISNEMIIIFITILGGLYFILPIIILWYKRKRFPKGLTIKDINI